jgi:hypothetical protein
MSDSSNPFLRQPGSYGAPVSPVMVFLVHLAIYFWLRTVDYPGWVPGCGIALLVGGMYVCITTHRQSTSGRPSENQTWDRP